MTIIEMKNNCEIISYNLVDRGAFIFTTKYVKRIVNKHPVYIKTLHEKQKTTFEKVFTLRNELGEIERFNYKNLKRIFGIRWIKKQLRKLKSTSGD